MIFPVLRVTRHAGGIALFELTYLVLVSGVLSRFRSACMHRIGVNRTHLEDPTESISRVLLLFKRVSPHYPLHFPLNQEDQLLNTSRLFRKWTCPTSHPAESVDSARLV